MSTQGYIRLRTNLKAVEGFVDNLKNDTELMMSINRCFADRCDPYVPYETGRLANVNITKTGVSYNAPYARYQYEGINRYTGGPLHYNPPTHPVFHPLATHHWDQAMLEAEGDVFRADCQELIDRRVRVFNSRAMVW